MPVQTSTVARTDGQQYGGAGIHSKLRPALRRVSDGMVLAVTFHDLLTHHITPLLRRCRSGTVSMHTDVQIIIIMMMVVVTDDATGRLDVSAPA